MVLDKLQPAPPQEAGMFVPYYQKPEQKALLPFALSLYKQGSFEGERRIEGGESIPFVATWYISTLPSDLTRCRLQFDGNAELSYEVMMPNSDFISFLMEVILNYKRTKIADFTRTFYRRLLHLDD